jgi:hypothetical protein
MIAWTMKRRIVPSQITRTLEKYFGPPGSQSMNSKLGVGGSNTTHLSVIVDLVEGLPEELWPNDAVTLHENVTAIKIAVRQEVETDELTRVRMGSKSLNAVGGSRTYPLQTIYDLLKDCPDQVPAEDTLDLPFIADADFKNLLRLDISAVERALSNSEWKAATVLAGSVVEALLLWAIEADRKGNRAAAVTALKNSDPDRWGELPSRAAKWRLEQMVDVAAEMGLIDEGKATKNTKSQCQIARDFRNLIHPAKAKRDGACNRATALSA